MESPGTGRNLSASKRAREVVRSFQSGVKGRNLEWLEKQIKKTIKAALRDQFEHFERKKNEQDRPSIDFFNDNWEREIPFGD